MRAATLLPLALLAAAPASSPVQALAGRYAHSFPNADVAGDKYTSENVVEIVPVSAAAAYLRVHTEWYNGHECSLSGIADARGDALVFRDPDTRFGACVLTVRRLGAKLRMDDSGGSCSQYCGARGTFSKVDLPFASRRPITYLKRLRASSEYKDALAAWPKFRNNGAAVRH